jgi:hypothetical protein
MPVLLFLLYALALSVIITRSGFFIKSGLPPRLMAGLFVLYGLAGCVHVWIAFHFFPNHGDIWEMFNYSVGLKHQLLNDYPAFIKEFFPDKFSVDIVGNHLGWSYYQLQGPALLQVVMNFFSFDNIYINTLLFCFLTMYGKMAFYRMLCERYPEQNVIGLILVFLIPSVLFWTSVIHKEGILFCCIGILLYCLQTYLRPFHLRKLAAVVISLLIIFITRKIILVMLIPALTIWWAAERTSFRMRYIIFTAMIGTMALFMLLSFINPSYSLFHQLSERQKEFIQLTGGSKIFLPVLGDDGQSFLNALPYAVLNGLFPPLPGASGKTIYILFSIESVALWSLIIRSIVKNRSQPDGFKTGMFIFALAACLVIGYTVPFSGAIVRYRSIFYPFLLLPLLMYHKPLRRIFPNNE